VRSERFDTPLIVIAHWLGALLAQRLLGRTRIAALLMLAPVPPEGTSLITPFLFATEPSIWRALLNFICGRRLAFDGMVDIVFSERMRKIEADQHAARMVFEKVWCRFRSTCPNIGWLPPCHRRAQVGCCGRQRQAYFSSRLHSDCPLSPCRGSHARRTWSFHPSRGTRTARCSVHRRLA
jgi:hypothetical protein